MRFKKGNKVEVFKSEVPSGAWHSAEIISGNGHNYTVQYAHDFGSTEESAVERVLRKAIRPCPPLDLAKSWMAGEVVEVLDDFSWKIATVLKVLTEEYYLVRLLGSSREFQTQKANMRARQSWKNDKWVVIGKSSRSSEIVKSGRVSSPNYAKRNDKSLVQATENATDLQESHVLSVRTLKRASHFVSSYAQACTGNVQKRRAIERAGECQRLISRDPSSLSKKGQCWRHACLASKGLKMMLGFPISALA